MRGLSIEIIKGIEYSNMIHSIKEELSINSDFSIYIGEDCNEYYKNIGGVLYIKNGLYDSDKKIVFIRTIDEAVFVHEFTHVKYQLHSFLLFLSFYPFYFSSLLVK